MTIKEFKLPDIGEGIAEGEIVAWKVKPGQTVKEEDEFVEVMTDKATVMITVPFDGVIEELLCKDGDIVPVESVIARIAVGAKSATTAEPAASTTATPSPTPTATAAVTAAPPTPMAAPTTAFVQASPGKVLAAPATRRRAREMGIDLAGITGTGPRGRITNDDLTTAPPAAVTTKPQPMATPVAAPPPGAREERVPFRGLRRKIAEAMARSKQTAAHFTYVDDINVTKLVTLRKEAKAQYAAQGINITYLPFIMKAVIEAMRQFPEMNSALDEATQELVTKHYFNFGIATDTEQGLVVPVIKDIDKKSIAQLAHDLQELAAATRKGKIGIDQLKGGTFTITNAGNIGGLFATPIINFPEVAILGVHAIKKTPVVNDAGEIEVGSVMYLSVSIDHRLVDGATGARWMNVIKDCLENPTRLLLGSI